MIPLTSINNNNDDAMHGISAATTTTIITEHPQQHRMLWQNNHRFHFCQDCTERDYLRIALIACITSAAVLSIVLIYLICSDMYNDYRRARTRDQDDDDRELSADFTSREFRVILQPRTIKVGDVNNKTAAATTADEEQGIMRIDGCFTIDEEDDQTADDSTNSSGGDDDSHGDDVLLTRPQQQHDMNAAAQRRLTLNPDECCAICLEPYSEDDQVSWSPGCDHHFHTSCMVEYAKATTNKRNRKNKRKMNKQVDCPLCREPFLRQTEVETIIAVQQQQQQKQQQQSQSQQDEQDTAQSEDRRVTSFLGIV